LPDRTTGLSARRAKRVALEWCPLLLAAWLTLVATTPERAYAAAVDAAQIAETPSTNDATAATASATAPDDDRPATLAPVTVVAERREEQQEKVPLALSVLTGDFLDDAGATRLGDIAFLLPSFSSERNISPFVTSFRLRGLANLANIPNFAPEVGLFVDGAYRSRSGLGDEQLLDVERIEVLRGPQSVLYPMNVSSGLVNIITRQPGDAPETYAAMDVGDYAQRELRAGASGPLGNGVRGGLSVAGGSRDGSIDDIVTGRDSGGGSSARARGQLAFELGDSATLRFIAGAGRRDGDCCAPDLLPGPASIALTRANGRPIDTDPFNRVTAYDRTNHSDGTQSDVLMDLAVALGWADLSALTSYDRYAFRTRLDLDQTALDIVRYADRQQAATFSQELRLTSDTQAPLDWMLGAYYYDNDFRRGTLDPDSPLVELGADISHTPIPGATGDRTSFLSLDDTRHVSAFGQIGWRITERFRLAAGARYVDEHNTIDVSSASAVAATPSLALTFGVPAPLHAARDTDGSAWNLSAQYAARDTLDLYATVARGFKPGGFNGTWGNLTAAQREFADERVLNREAGLKGRFFDDRLSVNLSAFDANYDNFQNASFIGTTFVVRNAQQVHDSGVELEGEARPLHGLLLNYAVEYLDLRYDRFVDGPCAFGRPPTDPVQGTCDLSGRTVPNAPQWRATLGAQVEHELHDGLAYLRIDGDYAGAHLTDFALDPRTRQHAYAMFNVRLGWNGARWSGALWCRNIGNVTAITLSAPQTLFGGIDGGLQYFLADPRTYGITIEYRYK